MSVNKAKEDALRYLSRSAATEERVRVKLRARGYDDGDIEGAVCDLRRVGLLDDEAYARDFARRLTESETVGARWIESKLVARGVPGALAARVAEEFAAEGADDALAAAREKARSMGHVDDAPTLVRRLAAQLQRRGFEAGEALDAARAVAAERGAG